MIKANAAIQIKNVEELKKNICDLIIHKSKRKRLSIAAKNALQNIPDPNYKILELLDPILTNTKGH